LVVMIELQHYHLDFLLFEKKNNFRIDVGYRLKSGISDFGKIL